ncbi:MAG TPA: anti-sigma factor [Verrucomicrobiae bacterium]|nr:anti-sigma factor [Verrucomicrobiae bacterium]
MNCAEFSSLKHAHADGELDLIRSLEVEEHLSACPGCSGERDNVQIAKTVIKTPGMYFQAPHHLKARIRGELGLEGARTNRAPWWRLTGLRLAIPAACALVAVALVLLGLTWNSREKQLVREVVASHVRSMMVDHKTDVASSDQHTVKPWFIGKLDFAPPVVDLAGRGYPLAGGRLDYVQNRPVAALVYQRRKHFINLFVWPAPYDAAFSERIAEVDGFNLVRWTRAGMEFWAVSDLNKSELGEFARLVVGNDPVEADGNQENKGGNTNPGTGLK